MSVVRAPRQSTYLSVIATTIAHDEGTCDGQHEVPQQGREVLSLNKEMHRLDWRTHHMHQSTLKLREWAFDARLPSSP